MMPLLDIAARAVRPQRVLTVSQHAAAHRVLTSAQSAFPGPWRNDRNPLLVEPMDALTRRNGVREVVIVAPVQFGKTEVGLNWLLYIMDHAPGPTMVVQPTEQLLDSFRAQKLDPMLAHSPVAAAALSGVANSRSASNTKGHKDFAGGLLFLEHGGNLGRAALKSVMNLWVDELDKFPTQMPTGEDIVKMFEGRNTAFPSSYKRLFTGSPGVKGVSRLESKWARSDQRRAYLACPHCGARQPLIWAGLTWSVDARHVVYVCRDCGAEIDERSKPAMLAGVEWRAENPLADPGVRGYTWNALYHAIGMGPRWRDLVREFLEAAHDPPKLRVFVSERLAEPWEDPAMRAVKTHLVRERAEPYRLRTAPRGVLGVTVGIDTQDDRLEVHVVGWGRGLAAWTLDYVSLPGDPDQPHVWTALDDYLLRPIEHESGALLLPAAVAIDIGGHRGEAVKSWVRRATVRRPMAVHGAVANTAPALSKPKLVDTNWRGRTDKRGVQLYQVGTVAIKHTLYARLSADADRAPEDRMVHFSDELEPAFFAGLTSEVFDPAKNRFTLRRGARNEPLDTWVYAYAATHHPELRWHRFSRADWDLLERRIADAVPKAAPIDAPRQSSAPPAASTRLPAASPFARPEWSGKL
jgi:phage terminase large subunit GpA-like protein